MTDLFHIIEDAQIIIRSKGVFYQKNLYRRGDRIYAGMGIHKDTRAQLLSHGISGVQAAHYDRYEYINEKRNALIAWEQRLDNISKGTNNSNVIPMGQVA